MPNTVIALKKSATPSATPVSLANGELAINFADGKLFYKHANGTILSIEGGGGGGSGDSFGTVNAAGTLIVADTAGDVLTLEAGSGITITGDAVNDKITISGLNIYNQANTALTTGQAAFGKANTAGTDAVNAFGQANTARIHANAAFGQANTATTNAGNAFGQANTARVHANAAFLQANTARDLANTKFNTSGGTISGDVDITGNLTVAGNVTTFTANNLVVNDPFIILANNNSGDVNDIGIAGHYNTNSHTGIFRSSGTKEWYVFSEYDEHFFYNGSGNIDISGNNFTLAVLNAYIKTSNLTLNGVNAAAWITASYNQANTAQTTGVAAFGKANTAGTDAVNAFAKANTAGTDAVNAFAKANTACTKADTAQTTAVAAFGQANTALTTGQAAFGQANTARTSANTVGSYANSAFGTANLGYAQANTALTAGQGAFGQANTSRLHANASFLQANTARDHANAAFAQANTSGGAAYFSGNNGDVGAASGLGDIFRVHTNTLTANVTIYSGNNALAAGPITIEMGKVLTIQPDARVVIV